MRSIELQNSLNLSGYIIIMPVATDLGCIGIQIYLFSSFSNSIFNYLRKRLITLILHFWSIDVSVAVQKEVLR